MTLIHKKLLVILIHILFLCWISMICFEKNEAILFEYFDGLFFRDYIRDQFIWSPNYLWQTVDPIRGLGNISFPINIRLSPVYFLQYLFFGQTPDAHWTYVGYAIEIFLGCILVANFLGIRLNEALAGAWFMTLLSFPYFPQDVLFPIYAMVPHVADIVVGGIILLWLFGKLGRHHWRYNLAIMLALAGTVTYLSLLTPAGMILLFPTMFIFGTVMLCRASRREALWKILAIGGTLSCLVLGGFSLTSYGTLINTAAALFPAELGSEQKTVYFVSMAFQHFTFSLVFFALGVIGTLIRAFFFSGYNRWMAISHLSAISLFMGGGLVIYWLFPSWNGPAAHYFEFILWPMLAVFAGWLAVITLRSMLMLAINKAKSEWAVQISILALPVSMMMFITERGVASSFKYPPSPSPITKLLKTKIGLNPGSIFRGRVASFTGYIGDNGGTNWGTLHNFDAKAYNETQDDHRMASFWHEGIPTLIEYGQLIRPATYLMLSRALARPKDIQRRNIIVFTRPQLSLLRILGVRFVIIESDLSGAKLVKRMANTNGRPDFRLYELPEPNLSGYSPTKSTVVSSASEVFERLRSKIDLTQEVLTDVDLPKDLKRATASLNIDRDGLNLRVSTDGPAVLVLPFEFSRCMKVTAFSGQASLFRANLILTGLLVNGDALVNIAHREGPFGPADCRLEDNKDMIMLNIQGAAKEFPMGSLFLEGKVPKKTGKSIPDYNIIKRITP